MRLSLSARGRALSLMALRRIFDFGRNSRVIPIAAIEMTPAMVPNQRRQEKNAAIMGQIWDAGHHRIGRLSRTCDGVRELAYTDHVCHQ